MIMYSSKLFKQTQTHTDRHTNICTLYKKSNSSNGLIIKHTDSHFTIPSRPIPWSACPCLLSYVWQQALSWKNASCSSVLSTISFWFTTAVKMKGNHILLFFPSLRSVFHFVFDLKNTLWAVNIPDWLIHYSL